MMIMPHPYGRMANRLILSTAFIIQAEEQGDSFLHLAFADYFRYFEGTKHSPFLYYCASRFVSHPKRKVFGCVNIWNTNDKRDEIYSLDQPVFLAKQHETRYLFVIGWSFRTPPAVCLKHKPLIRKIFTPIPKHREAVARLSEKLRAGADHVVGVHIRQTDYKKFANGKFFYSLDVYRHAMRAVESQLKGSTRFLLSSDTTLDPAAFKAFDIILGTGHPVEDNYALATCDYIVGPPSTYTAWASYYGDVPKQFIQSPDSEMSLANFTVQTTI